MEILLCLFLVLAIISIVHEIQYPRRFSYDYKAATVYPSKNHSYSFNIVKEANGYYLCYIVHIPPLRGRDTSNYVSHLWTKGSKRWICWTGNIKYPEQAKTLCRKWADATQVFIDTGIPLPEFTSEN